MEVPLASRSRRPNCSTALPSSISEFHRHRLIAVSFGLQWLALAGLSKRRLLIGIVAAIS
jgi:hypothetical protein